MYACMYVCVFHTAVFRQYTEAAFKISAMKICNIVLFVNLIVRY